MSRMLSERAGESRYPVLTLLAVFLAWAGSFLLTVGGVAVVVGMIALLGGVATNTLRAWSVVALAWGAGGAFAGVQLLAAGTLIRLAMDVEANTRASARALDRIAAREDPHRGPGGEPRFRS